MNWDSICYVLKAFGIKKSTREHFESASRYLLLDRDVLDDSNTVYICTGSGNDQAFKKSLIISIGSSSVTADNYIELGSGSVASVFNALMEPEQNLKTLKDLLQDSTTSQQIIDIASSYLDSPFFYFDESYRIIAITRNLKLENDREWEYMTTQRFLSPESARIMQESGDLDRLARNDKPVIYDADFFPFVSVVVNIRYLDRPYARLNRLFLNGTVNPINLEECAIIASSLQRLLGLQTNIVHTGPVDNMLGDLLNGMQLPEKLIRDRMQRRYHLNDEPFMVCVIDVNVSEDQHVPSYYSALAGRIFESELVAQLTYEDNLVLILQPDSANGPAPIFSKIGSFLTQQKLRGGISSIFQKLGLIKTHYEQALASLGYARSGNLVRFDDIKFDYLISLIPDERRELFIPDEIKKLDEEQKNYSFPLHETLRVYLESSCSIQQAAHTLFLHKNTMLYRINKLRELLNTNFEDPYQRMQLLLALRAIAND